jgi:D-glycerate 3-kinase
MLEILKKLLNNKQFKQTDLEYLLTDILAQTQLAKAFNITPENGLNEVEKRANLCCLIYPEFLTLCHHLKLTNFDQNLTNLWKVWLPLALQLSSKQEQLGRTLIQGILGGQGTGKTTLTSILTLILTYLDKNSLAFSIDDLYKTYQERQKLRAKNPFLIWRGPPGTHDVNMGIDILEKLRQPDFMGEILIPRFDKSLYHGAGDRITPQLVQKPDIILFEGWFVGVIPVDNSLFDHPPWPIITEEDKQLALFSNKNLQEYLPLWEKLDRLMIIYPDNYHHSKKWRLEAEQKMIASGKTGMSEEEINQFVEYFWKALHPDLFISPLINNSQLTDLVIEIKGDRTIGNIFQP